MPQHFHHNSRITRAALALAAAAVLAGCALQPPAPPTVSAVVKAPVAQAWQQGRPPDQAPSPPALNPVSYPPLPPPTHLPL